MLPLTERKVVVVPHTLAAVAAAACVILAMVADREPAINEQVAQNQTLQAPPFHGWIVYDGPVQVRLVHRPAVHMTAQTTGQKDSAGENPPAESEAGSGRTEATGSSPGAPDRRREGMQWSPVTDLTTLLLPGRRSGN